MKLRRNVLAVESDCSADQRRKYVEPVNSTISKQSNSMKERSCTNTLLLGFHFVLFTGWFKHCTRFQHLTLTITVPCS